MRPALLTLLILPLASCAPSVEPPRPPIVVISIDTLRSDWLPMYGDSRVATPALDQLAADGVVFERAFSEVPLTLPSHVSAFSGQIPPRHGVRDNVGFPVDPSRALLLQTRLKGLGYSTMGVVSAQVLGRRTGFATGFDRWDEPAPRAEDGTMSIVAERAGSVAVQVARGWLANAGESPLFLFVHLYEPHTPYRPPEPFRSRYGATYAAEIAAADALVGELIGELRRLGLYEQALVILLSDHGEGLGDHGEDEHGLLLYREALQVPLVVKLPGGARAGERVSRNVGLIDVTPTVLEVVGVAPGEMAGISLLRQDVAADRTLYAETMYPLLHYGWSELAAAISGNLHLIDAPRPELYDLATDPAQRHDLLARGEPDRRPLASLRGFLAGIDRSIAAPEEVEAETIATLGALGYLGQPSLPEDRSNLANPNERVPVVRPLLLGMRLYHEGELEQALAPLLEATELEDLAANAWRYLGATYDELGRKDEALEAYQRGAAIAGAPSSLGQAAVARLLELGRTDDALETLAGEIARFPDSAMLRVLVSRAELQRGDLVSAQRAADLAVTLEPDLAEVYYQRGVVTVAQGNGPGAVGDLARACQLDARHIGARKVLALVRYSQGDSAATQRLLEEVLAIDPQDADALADLAILAAEARAASVPG